MLRTSFRRAHTSDLIGKYAQRPGLFVSAPHLPSTLRFGSDDTLATSGSSGVADLQLRWTLDSVEDVIRVANSEWDRRIRVRPTWTGFVLEMRIDDSAHHSSDGTSRAEEMEFRRTD